MSALATRSPRTAMQPSTSCSKPQTTTCTLRNGIGHAPAESVPQVVIPAQIPPKTSVFEVSRAVVRDTPGPCTDLTGREDRRRRRRIRTQRARFRASFSHEGSADLVL